MFAYFHAPVSWTDLARRTARETYRDSCFGLAAQLAFYFLLGLFPALLVVVSLLAYLPLDDLLGQVLERFGLVVPTQILDVVRGQIERVRAGHNRGLVTLALAGALWSSSSAVTAIISTLNWAYDIEEWRPWWKTRGIAILLTIALAVFVVLALLVVVGGPRIGDWLVRQVGLGEPLRPVWTLLQWPLAFGLVVFAVDLIYYFAPNADTEWVWITPGSLVATTLWLLSSLAFRLYVEMFGNFAAVYGAIGSVVVLMLWLYATGLSILIGGELNAEIDRVTPEPGGAPAAAGGRKKIGPKKKSAPQFSRTSTQR